MKIVYFMKPKNLPLRSENIKTENIKTSSL